MTPLDLLLDLLVRAIALSLPIGVGSLAVRRVFLSRTSNIWLYALTVGYAAFTTMGLLPWAPGIEPVSATFIVLAAVCPIMWLAIVMVCGAGRTAPYDIEILEEQEEIIAAPEPLVLRNPIMPEPVAVFRHHRRVREPVRNLSSDVVDVARSMRGRASSEARRVRKLLPPPAPDDVDLPFLK